MWGFALCWLTLPGMIAPDEIFEKPSDAYVAAASDSRKLNPADGKYIRWLTLYNIPEKNRQPYLDAFAFHANSLSREVALQRVTKGPSGIILVTPTLLRVDLRDFTWDRDTWEKLALFEPYFHVPRKTAIGKDGKLWARNDANDDWVYANTVIQTTAPYLSSTPEGKHAVEDLVKYTGSSIPVVRLDWFIAQTGIERDGQVGYYDFLGLGDKEQDFTDLIGIDLAKLEKAKKEVAAVLWKSGVVKNNRRILDFDGFWATEDFKNSRDKRNISEFLLGENDPPKGDASERYGRLANGLFATWLQNADGKRQNFVPPDTIATDGHTVSQDRLIYAGERCFACHVEGLRPIKDYARRIFKDALQLKSIDYDKFVQLRNLYLTDLDGKLAQDRAIYSKALLELNGLTSEKNAANYEAAFDTYEEDEVDIDKFAIELGVSREEFVIALANYEIKHGPLPAALAGLVQKVPITRDYAEQFYQQAQLIIAK